MAQMGIVQWIRQGITNTAAAISIYNAGEAAEEAGHYNETVAERRAQVARQGAAYGATRHRENTRKLLASQRARFGAGGMGFEGSPLEVMAETARSAEMDARAIEYSGELEAMGYESQGRLAAWQGKSALKAAKFKAIMTLLDFGEGTQGSGAGMPLMGGESTSAQTSAQTQADITRYNQLMAVK